MTPVAGKVYLIGAGPGAPDLITLRGAAVLRRAQIVFHDALVDPGTIALAVHAEKIAVGKRCGRHSTAQRFINKRLIDAAARFDTVVRLKGGDPMLFGRAQEEIDALRCAGIEVEIVPGVTAALAASAEVGVSLTRRGTSRSVTLVTPRVGDGEQAGDWTQSVINADCAALYMAAGQAREIAVRLIASGMRTDMPVVVVEDASLPTMTRTVLPLGRLGRAETLGLRGPAMILLGEVFRDVVAGARPDSSATPHEPLPEALSA